MGYSNGGAHGIYILSQYADFQFRPLEKLFGTLGFRRDEHTLAGEFLLEEELSYKKDSNTKYRMSLGNGIKFATLNDYFYDTNMKNSGLLDQKKLGYRCWF